MTRSTTTQNTLLTPAGALAAIGAPRRWIVAIAAALALAAMLLGSSSFNATPADAAGELVPLYTWYSPSRGDYFSTTNPAWAGTSGQVRSPDYRFDGVQGLVFSPNLPQPAGTAKLYSWWSLSRGDNFLTSNPAWASTAPGEVRSGYSFMRLEGYVNSSSTSTCRVRLNSFWNATVADNAANSNDGWLSAPPAGYAFYRIEGYMCSAGAPRIQILGGDLSGTLFLTEPRPDLPNSSLEVPIAVRVTIPRHHTVRSVRLGMDDASGGATPIYDSMVINDADAWATLIGDGAVTSEIQLIAGGTTDATLSYDVNFRLAPWQYGRNGFVLKLETVDPYSTTSQATVTANFRCCDFALNRATGGTYETTFVPMRAAECNFMLCKDADKDGLLDLWENIAVADLSPQLFLDEDEEFFDHANHHVAVFTRVSPVEGQQIMFKSFVAWSKDYGAALDLGNHNGDLEGSLQLWTITGPRSIALDSITSHRHDCRLWLDLFLGLIPFPLPTAACLVPDSESPVIPAADFAFIGTHPLLFIEMDKHGTWHDAAECDIWGAYDCDPSARTLRLPPAINVGEQPPFRRPFVDVLDAIAATGPHASFVNLFPNEAVWTPWQWNGDKVVFCGGVGNDGTCSNSLSHLSKSDQVPLVDGDPRIVTGRLGR